MIQAIYGTENAAKGVSASENVNLRDICRKFKQQAGLARKKAQVHTKSLANAIRCNQVDALTTNLHCLRHEHNELARSRSSCEIDENPLPRIDVNFSFLPRLCRSLLILKICLLMP
jgi:hypothetical protein